MQQYKWAQKALEELEEDPSGFVARLDRLRREVVLRPENAFAYLASDLDKLTEKHGNKAVSVWKDDFFAQPPEMLGKFPAKVRKKVIFY